MLFWLCTKRAAPGNFFPGMVRVVPAIVCDLHPLLLIKGFGLRASSARLMNSHSSITSDRPFPCTLQLPGCPQASRLEYHSMLLSTAVESGSAGRIFWWMSRSRNICIRDSDRQVWSALACSVFRLHQQSSALEIYSTFKALFVIFFHF